MLPVTRPHLPTLKHYLSYVDKAFERKWLTNFGPLHDELQERLCEYLGVRHLLLVANGTLALQIAFKTMGLEGEVITTPFTFAATSGAIKWQSLEPRYADIEPCSFNLNPNLVDALVGERTSSIVPVHVYGGSCRTELFDEIGVRHGIPIIYDASHAFGVNASDGGSLLEFGDASILSFHATKIFHTAEGGAIVFKDEGRYQLARRYTNFGFDEHGNILDVGINAKMSELHAAMGLAVLDSIDDIINIRVELVSTYRHYLDGSLLVDAAKDDTTSNGAYMPVIFPTHVQRERALKALESRGIMARRYFSPALDATPVYANVSGDYCPIARDVSSKILCLPLFPGLMHDEVRKIAAIVNTALA